MKSIGSKAWTGGKGRRNHMFDSRDFMVISHFSLNFLPFLSTKNFCLLKYRALLVSLFFILLEISLKFL